MAESSQTKSSTIVKPRNLVVLGKTGAGKSTVANRILDPDDGTVCFAVSHEVMTSVTEGTSSYASVLETDAGKYTVKVVDTQGFFDTRGISNDTIMNDIKKYFKERIPEGLNLILFVFKHGRWTQEEQKTYNYITKHFQREVSAISALVITGCDNYTDEEKQRIVEEFKQNQPDISAFMKKGIHTVAFPDPSKLKPAFKTASLEDQKIDQEHLRAIVYSSEEMKLTREILHEGFWEKVRSCTIL